eukprot:symbB.v1.2.019231.t1/scaffold1566.1/size111259/5
MSRFDADVEQEFVRKVPAREGQWPRISRYETSTGDGFTIAGSVTALNQVLSEIQLTPPADAPNSGSVSVTLHRTPTSTEPESMFPPGTFDTATAVAWGNLALQITPLSKSSSTCFIQGPAATFVKPGIDSRNMNITVYAETSASSQVTEEIASELHEFRISVRRGQISLDVNKFPAARICPPFYPDVGGCGMDELDAWVIYGRIADAALAIESLVYTPPFGFAGQDVMRISGSCSAVTLEMTLNIVKGFLPPLISCCNNGAVLKVHRALEPAPVPPCALENNAYGEIPAVAQVTFSSDLGQLAFWPVQGLYFDHGFDTIPMHNVSSQIVVDGPGTILQRGLASKLAMLHVPETEERTSGLLVIKVLDARSNLSSTSECPIHVSVGRREGLPNIYLDMPTPNASYLLSGALGPRRSHALRGMEMSIPSFGLVSAALRTPCLVKLQAHRGEILPPLRAPRRQAVEWTEEQRGNYTLLAESVQAANEVVSQLRFVVHEEEIDRCIAECRWGWGKTGGAFGSSFNSLAPVLVASVSAGAVGAYFFWRYQKAAKAVEVAKVQAVEVQAEQVAKVEEIKSQEEPIFQTSGDDNIQVDFCTEGELQQCEQTLGVVQCLTAERGESTVKNTSLDASLGALDELVPAYAKKLEDKKWLAAHAASLEQVSDALRLLLLADDERNLEAAAKNGRDIPELMLAAQALVKILTSGGGSGGGGCGGKGNCGSGGGCGGGGCGSKKAAENEVPKTSGCAPGGCGSCKKEGSCNKKSETPEVKVNADGVLRLSA